MWFWILLGLGGAFIAGAALASESEQRQLIAPPEKPPSRLLTTAAKNVTTMDIVPRASQNRTFCQIGIVPGAEAFTPPLPEGMLKLVFSGAYGLKSATYTQWYGVDACYWTDKDLNYLNRHSSLMLDGNEFRADPVESDRAAHRYGFSYQWKGGRLGVLLKPPAQFYDIDTSTGVIDLAVVWIGPAEGTEEAEERKREKERIRTALEWATTAHLDSNFLDQQYRENYAGKHTAKILNTFSNQWRQEYLEMIADEPLFTLVQAEHPHVLEYFEARFQVIRIAQRLAAEPDPQPPVPEPPPPKKTPDEKRDADLDWFRVTTTDYREKAILRLVIEQEFLEELRKQFPNLNENELQHELQRFRDEALNSPDKGTTVLPGMKTY
jgi:hypothetical protein